MLIVKNSTIIILTIFIYIYEAERSYSTFPKMDSNRKKETVLGLKIILMERGMEERRRLLRIEIDVLVNCVLKAKTRTKNISQKGICLITKINLKKEVMYILYFL